MFYIFIARNDPLTGDWREDAGDGDKLRLIYLLGDRILPECNVSISLLQYQYILTELL